MKYLVLTRYVFYVINQCFVFFRVCVWEREREREGERERERAGRCQGGSLNSSSCNVTRTLEFGAIWRYIRVFWDKCSFYGCKPPFLFIRMWTLDELLFSEVTGNWRIVVVWRLGRIRWNLKNVSAKVGMVWQRTHLRHALKIRVVVIRVCRRANTLDQRFSNFFQVGTTFISQNVLRTTLLLGLSNSLGLP